MITELINEADLEAVLEWAETAFPLTTRATGDVFGRYLVWVEKEYPYKLTGRRHGVKLLVQRRYRGEDGELPKNGGNYGAGQWRTIPRSIGIGVVWL